jgi:acetyltransferase-like isoleucine patch superfamily enzyme
VAGGIILIYFYAFVFYRLFLLIMPLKEGEIEENSRDEFVYHVYLLFYLIFFNSIIRSGFFPVPLMRVVYIVLGARLGPNTYSSGYANAPNFIDVGANTIIGQDAALGPRLIEGKRLAHYMIRIGNNVTIGAHAVILCDVTIGDNAIVAANALVLKGTRIGPGEVWGGVPARLLRRNIAEPEQLDQVYA